MIFNHLGRRQLLLSVFVVFVVVVWWIRLLHRIRLVRIKIAVWKRLVLQSKQVTG